MNAPMDQQIMEALQQRLQVIRSTNGYATDLGEHVMLEAVDLPDDKIVVELVDATESAQYQSASKRTARLLVTAIATIPQTRATARRDARLVLADMRRALAGLPLSAFPTGTQKLEMAGRRITPPDDGSGFIEAELDLAIQFVEHHKEHTP